MKAEINKYLFLGLFILLGIASYLLIKPFLTALLTSLILAYVFYPLYRWLRKKINNQTASALIVLLVIFILILVPLGFFISALLSTDTNTMVGNLKSIRTSLKGDVIQAHCENQQTLLCTVMNKLYGYFDAPQIEAVINQSFSEISIYILKVTKDIIFAIPFMILSLFVMFFVLYYLLKDGADLVIRAKKIIPLKKIYQEKIIKEFGDVTYAVIYGNFIVAIIQGALALAGFWLFGFRNPLLLGILTAFAGLVPFIGTGLVWFPVALFKIINGLVQGGGVAVIRGILMMLWGALFVSSIDNLIRPKIIGTKTTLHPALILLGVLGGISLFGFIGIVIGPILLSVSLIFIDIYTKQRKKNNHS